MDILDRIAALLRTIFADTGSPSGTTGSRPSDGQSGRPSTRPADPDLAAAWDELDGYLGAGRAEADTGHAHGDPRGGGGGTRTAPLPPDSLRSDYANLEVPFGADIETVRRAYKRLVMHYHPDRHAGNPEKLRVATEITKKLNESFERIRSFQERTGAGNR